MGQKIEIQEARLRVAIAGLLMQPNWIATRRPSGGFGCSDTDMQDLIALGYAHRVTEDHLIQWRVTEAGLQFLKGEQHGK